MKQLRQDIFDSAKSLVCLPTLDKISETLSLLVAGPKVSLSRLFDVIRYDIALTSRIIAVANSAWHNRGVPVANLKRAMMVLGTEEIKDIVICAVFYDGLLKKSGLGSDEIFALWSHSLLVAFTSRLLARTPKEAEKTFTAGLLHDVGKVPLQLACDYTAKYGKQGWNDACSYERNEFGVDHQELGAYMATEWRLPEEYRLVIRGHHEEITASPLAEVVKTADILATSDTEDEGLQQKKREAITETNKIMYLFALQM